MDFEQREAIESLILALALRLTQKPLLLLL
jgi:hypothetical protein